VDLSEYLLKQRIVLQIAIVFTISSFEFHQVIYCCDFVARVSGPIHPKSIY